MTSQADLRARARQEYTKIDPNGKIWDDNILDFYVNESYTEIQRAGNYQWKECEQLATLTIDGSTMYDLPTDFVKIEDLKVNGYDLKKVSRAETFGYPSQSGVPNVYYIHRKQIGFYPTPDSNSDIKLIYRMKLPKITNTQDSLLPEEFDEAIALYSCYLMCLSVEKIEKAQTVLAQYTRVINGLFGMDMYDDETQGFSLKRV